MNDFDLLTNKADLYQSRWAPSPDVRAPENGVLVEIERFALTANNFTYAKLGDAFGYWRYFPAPEGFGRVPVWGVGRVIELHADGVAEGERVYGFLPISTRCVLTPALRGKLGFVDGAAHRTDLPPAYKEYRLIDREAIFESRDENAYLALRPVFILGFFLAEWLAEQSFFGCHRIIVSSASSKAAAALVHQLGRRVETVGLTAERNLAAVASMGLFDKAVAYSQIAGTRGSNWGPAVFVDIAGDLEIADLVQRTLGAALVQTIGVGAVRSDPAQFRSLADANAMSSKLFFAPAHIPRLRALWGAALLRERLAQSWTQFLSVMRETLTFENHSGRAGISRAYDHVARGSLPGDVITILSAPNLD